jgi:hypothetical protein
MPARAFELQVVGSSYVSSKQRLANFRFWHVETLLNQASDLLDRCLRERREYDAASEVYRRLQIDLARQADQKKLAEDRIATGAHRSEFDALDKECAAAAGSRAELKAATDYYALCVPYNSPAPGPWRDGAAYHTALHTQNAYGVQADKAAIYREVARQEIDRKVIEKDILVREYDALVRYSSADEIFDYLGRAKQIEARVEQDFQDAFDRLTVASQGLASLYGYKPALPTDLTKPDSMNSVVLWLRAALQWVAAFSQLDQGSLQVVSLRKLVGEPSWKAIHTTAQRTGTLAFKFDLPQDLFQGLMHVRLRGLSAVVHIQPNAKGPWKAEIRLPSKARARHLNDDNTAGSFELLDQSDLPSCMIGRVESNQSPRNPELCGLISLFNASPLADPNAKPDEQQWLVAISTVREDSADLSAVDDVMIEVNVSGRRAKP